MKIGLEGQELQYVGGGVALVQVFREENSWVVSVPSGWPSYSTAGLSRTEFAELDCIYLMLLKYIIYNMTNEIIFDIKAFFYLFCVLFCCYQTP